MKLTPTAIELLDSVEFADKRELELRTYITITLRYRCMRGGLTRERYWELRRSTESLREQWSRHANELWARKNAKVKN